MSGTMGNGVADQLEDKGRLSLASIKKDIETSYKAFRENSQRYRDFFILVFKTAIGDAERTSLAVLGKPPLESPILEAYISREVGEFSKHVPQIDIHAAEGLMVGHLDDDYTKMLKVLQAHSNEIVHAAEANGFSDDVLDDTMGGGFSVAKVGTQYVNEKSFMQKIVLDRMVNPTLCGFDPLAEEHHKGDGRYCFELHPMTQEEFAREFGEERAKTFNFTRNVSSFSWTYKNLDVKVVLVADYYVKVEKTVTLLRLAENDLDLPVTMTLSEYNKMIKEWDRVEQPPVELERRRSTMTRIDRYRICQNEILDHAQTFYPMLPLVFIDGDSKRIQNMQGGQIEQMTRPYVLHAKDMQKLMNFAMQTIGQELEDMPRNTYMVPVAAIPKAYVKAYQNPQVAGVLPWNHKDLETGQDIPPPSVVQRTATPPLVQETFMGAQNIVQQILGNYDAALGIADGNISGKALQEGAMQSNVSATRYILGYIRGLQRCIEIAIHLIPLLYTTPRTIPIRLPNGKRDYQVINAEYPKIDKQKQMLQKAQEMGLGGMQNQIEETGEDNADSEQMENAIMFNYDPKDLNVTVTPGVNARIQKQVSFELLTRAMGVSPTLAEFFNRQGLGVILESLDLPGIEGLKDMVEQFQAQMAKEAQDAKSMPTDTDKIVQAEIMKSRLEAQARDQKTQVDMALGIAKAAIAKEEAETKRLELELKAHEAHMKLSMDRENQASKAASDTIALAVDVMKHQAEVDMTEKAQMQGQNNENI